MSGKRNGMFAHVGLEVLPHGQAMSSAMGISTHPESSLQAIAAGVEQSGFASVGAEL